MPQILTLKSQVVSVRIAYSLSLALAAAGDATFGSAIASHDTPMRLAVVGNALKQPWRYDARFQYACAACSNTHRPTFVPLLYALLDSDGTRGQAIPVFLVLETPRERVSEREAIAFD